MKGGDGLTPKREAFCVEYLVDLNATQAAIRAGYSEKTAYSMGQQLLKNIEVQNRIKELQRKHFNDRIMTVEEVQARISDIARGDMREEVVVVLGDGTGATREKIITKQVSAKEQLRALETLGKYHHLDKEYSADDKDSISFVFDRDEVEQ